MQKILRNAILTLVALAAFAANSILGRAALTATSIDPVSLTAIRIVSGALMLWLIVRTRPGLAEGRGSWARRWRCSPVPPCSRVLHWCC